MEMIIFSFCKQVSGLGNRLQTTLRPLDINLSESSSLPPQMTIYAFDQWSLHHCLQTNNFPLRCFAAFTYFGNGFIWWLYIYYFQTVIHCLRNTSCMYRKQLKEAKKSSLIGVHFAYSTQTIWSSSSWLLQALWQSRPPKRGENVAIEKKNTKL